MGSTVRTQTLIFACVSIACGERSGDPGSPVEIVRDFEDPAGGMAYAGRWVFEGGSQLSGVQLSPSPASPGAEVTARFETEGVCGGRVGLLAPRSAAHQRVYRGKTLDYGSDPRDQWVSLEGGDGPQQVQIRLAKPWHAERAVVVFEHVCSGVSVPVLEGARVEGLVDGHPVPGLRAVLGTVDVAREPTQVVAARAAVTIDGELGSSEWPGASHPLVASLDGEPVPDPVTSVWFGWDDESLLVAAHLRDVDIWTEFERHDDPLYRQEAFEVFVAGPDATQGYLEFQVSAANVTFDAHFPEYRKGDEAWDSRWRTAVAVQGTINDRHDRDEGWTVEVAIPWSEVCAKTGVECPVSPGRQLRVNAFRLEKADRKRQSGYALSPTLVPDFHAWQNAAVLVVEG